MTTQLPDDRDMNSAVRSWLHEDDEPVADRNRHIGRIMGRVDETRQRRRHWPLNPFGRRAMHSATGTEGGAVRNRGRSWTLAPARVMTVVVLALVATAGLLWSVARPPADTGLPAGWEVDPADEAVFERLATLWVGDKSDLATTRETYAEDAVYHVLWLDDEETIEGSDAIWTRMHQSPPVDPTAQRIIRFDDHFYGAHRYLVYSAWLPGPTCSVWIKDDVVTRHDCIRPMSPEDEELPAFIEADASATARRERLLAAFQDAQDARSRDELERVISPEIVHHVMSTNLIYTLEGFDEYARVFTGLTAPRTFADVDLPASEGELRWANVSSVGTGSLCIFSARDELIIRHDCIVPSTTSVPPDLVDVPGS